MIMRVNAWIAIDGEIVPAEKATISVFDRGFLYGDSVFEVYRSYGGVRFLEEAHLRRLARSARIIGIELPVDLDTLAREMASLHAASGLGDAYLRVLITRGEGPLGLDPHSAHSPKRVAFAAPLRTPPKELYERGTELVTLSGAFLSGARRAAGAKASNYLENILAQRSASEMGAHEALFVDESGALLEGATSNFFVVCDGSLHTPPLESGILPGITRAFVLELAASIGLSVHEGRVDGALLGAASEAFITSSIREILPVRAIDSAKIGGGAPGPITRRLHALYRERIEEARAPLSPK